MISTGHRFIFLHVPKTAGNSIQTVLLPFSDDDRVCTGHQDGQDRYEVRGPVTPRKHATLEEYHARLGRALTGYRVAISVRHPFERALSFYFSPHRWYRQADDGSWTVQDPAWDEDAFRACLGSMASAASFLRANGERARADYVLRQEALSEDFARMIEGLGLPRVCRDRLPHVNRSASLAGLPRDLLASRALRDAVEHRFSEDMNLFGYASYGLAE